MALTSRQSRRRRPTGLLPGPSRPWWPSSSQSGEGLFGALSRRGLRRLKGLSLPQSFYVLLPPARQPPPDCHLPLHPRCSPHPFSGWDRTSELSWEPFFFELNLACLAALLGKVMMSQDVHFCGSWKREQELVLFYTSSRVELRNSTYPNRFFLVLRYEVNFAFSISRVGKVPYLALGYSSCSCSTLQVWTNKVDT